MSQKFPLEEKSINDIYNSSDKINYEIPIYQRNYAWGKEEIGELIQDVYDAFQLKLDVYYIGTLVTFYRGENVYEVIDGQQRLTTIYLILKALNVRLQNKLTYKARRSANITVENITDLSKKDEIDSGIKNGFDNAKELIFDIVQKDMAEFTKYFLHHVIIIHYIVPKDIDLNHYFEVMNSRGEQLEMHEIVKANLLSELKTDTDRNIFSTIWEACSNMDIYLQQSFPKGNNIFGDSFPILLVNSFSEIQLEDNVDATNRKSILELMQLNDTEKNKQEKKDTPDKFQSIIDFPNFLLIVLKITRLLNESTFNANDFTLDDKELIKQFKKVKSLDENFVKQFGYNLLKSKFLLDNYVVHHTNEEDTTDSNPWKLQYINKDKKNKFKNLSDDDDLQKSLVHLLSMFEVSFTPRQRKNYLFYCLHYLFTSTTIDIADYRRFVEQLADKYFYDIYLNPSELSDINVPRPSAFDNQIIYRQTINCELMGEKRNFNAVYGNVDNKSKGISLFVFNYMDFKIWKKYAEELKGEKKRPESRERKEFFDQLGCTDFGLDTFNKFYFSRTRRSLEHYYPQANINSNITEVVINCFGNYAMIGSEANSSGSNWSPKAKLDHYLDSSHKIRGISIASLKFMIMMQMCRDNITQNVRKDGYEWERQDIERHQNKMIALLNGEKQ